MRCNQGIVVECKNRQMRSINQAELDKWLEELINAIECAQSAPELQDFDMGNTMLNTGLLLIHAMIVLILSCLINIYVT